jgi:hypothetical protein
MNILTEKAKKKKRKQTEKKKKRNKEKWIPAYTLFVTLLKRSPKSTKLTNSCSPANPSSVKHTKSRTHSSTPPPSIITITPSSAPHFPSTASNKLSAANQNGLVSHLSGGLTMWSYTRPKLYMYLHALTSSRGACARAARTAARPMWLIAKSKSCSMNCVGSKGTSVEFFICYKPSYFHSYTLALTLTLTLSL